MCIEIIRDKDNLFGMWIEYIGSKLEGIGEIYCCPSIRDNGFAFAGKRFENHKYIRYTIALIYGIYFFRIAGGARNTSFLDELFVRLVNANDRIQGIIRSLIHIKNIFHFGDKLGACFRYAPLIYEPRLNFVFFIVSQTVLSVI